MSSKKLSIYEKALQKCIKKGIIKSDCDQFLRLDFEMKLKRCRTKKCKKFYRSKIKMLSRKKSSKLKSKRKSLRLTKKRSKSKKSSKRNQKDGDIPILRKYKRCYAFKGFWC
jgi:hypothetical protein